MSMMQSEKEAISQSTHSLSGFHLSVCLSVCLSVLEGCTGHSTGPIVLILLAADVVSS